MRFWLALAGLLLLLLLLPLPSLAGPQDVWTIDPQASSLTFNVAQLGSIVSGRFPSWTGEIVLDPDSPAAARIDIRIEMRQATTSNRDVDTLMRGPNLFDVGKFPEARFVATSISGSGDSYEARGKLTIRNITRDAALPFTLSIADNPAKPGQLRATAYGQIIIKRLDYGVGQNEWAATGQVANEVTVVLNIVAGRAR